MSEQLASRERAARKMAEDILGTAPELFSNPLTVLASPAWRGIEGDIWRARSVGTSVIIKNYHPDTEFYVDPETAIHATEQAGKLGVGPEVLKSRAEDGLAALVDLVDPWRAGGLQDAVDAGIRSKVIENKKAFQAGAQLCNDASIFDEIEGLFAIVQRENIYTHKDAHVFLDFLRDANAKLNSLGRDRCPCHRDGNTANLMVGQDHSIQLLDFDLAANCDPFEDIGCYLVEFFENDVDARAGFEEWYGNFNEGLFQRSMIYGLADDMRWGLIGAIMAAKSPRSHLEFSKYSAWRFIRLEMRAKSSDANDRIRTAA
ncbi:phosphotransferase [Hoeflea sp. TYP-13]|uniref:phosphotransferase n=1 Tax=Hoeflea sp. TYP-13 TaxID=3230023 RepID=UPI0034C5F34F